MADLDRNGRKRKVYLARHNPYRKWSEGRFVRKYRLSKKRVKRVAKRFGEWTDRTKGSRVGGGLSYIEQVCLALRYFATGAAFSVIAETQQVSEATVSRVVNDVSWFFYLHAADYIHWPHRQRDKVGKAANFYQKHKQHPFVFGCIDGTHIQIIAPKKNGYEGAHPPEGVFVNRKGFHSINAMIVCDADQYITHIDASFAGSANDQYSFASSPLYEEAESGDWGTFFLLGDSGYTLKEYMMTPYDNPRGPRQRAFNRWHRSTRCIIERTIGVMKQRWRVIDASGGYLHHTPEKACRIITTCACLHNLAVLDRTPHRDAEDDGHDRFRPVRVAPLGPVDHNQGDIDPEAVDHRDEYVAANFNRRAPRQQ